LSLGFYMDEHVPSAVTNGLRRRGVDVLTVQEDGRRRRPDPELLDRAAELSRVAVTMDDDFLAEATRRQRAGASFAGVVYTRQSAISIGRCIQDLELIAKASDLADYASRVEYLPL
jgi:hypothetical protein